MLRFFVIPMKNSCLRNAPRDRRILALNKTWAFDNGDWKHTGYCWTEIWYNKENWVIWCGCPRTSTTEIVDADAWAEIPLEINT